MSLPSLRAVFATLRANCFMIVLGSASAAVIAAGCSSEKKSEAPAQSQALSSVGDVLLVVGAPDLSDADRALRDRLESLGYGVTVVDDDVVTAADATNRALILVSESVLSVKVTDKFKTAPVPVIALEVSIWDDLGMTGGAWQQDIACRSSRQYCGGAISSLDSARPQTPARPH